MIFTRPVPYVLPLACMVKDHHPFLFSTGQVSRFIRLRFLINKEIKEREILLLLLLFSCFVELINFRQLYLSLYA